MAFKSGATIGQIAIALMMEQLANMPPEEFSLSGLEPDLAPGEAQRVEEAFHKLRHKLVLELYDKSLDRKGFDTTGAVIASERNLTNHMKRFAADKAA